MDKELIKKVTQEVIREYVAKYGTKPFATSANKSDIAKKVLKRCHQKYQKNVLDKLIDND